MKTIALAILTLATVSCSKGQDNITGKWKLVNHATGLQLQFKDGKITDGVHEEVTNIGFKITHDYVLYPDQPTWLDDIETDIGNDTTMVTVSKFIYRIHGDTLEMRGWQGKGDTTRFTSFDRNDTLFTGIFVRN